MAWPQMRRPSGLSAISLGAHATYQASSGQGGGEVASSVAIIVSSRGLWPSPIGSNCHGQDDGVKIGSNLKLVMRSTRRLGFGHGDAEDEAGPAGADGPSQDDCLGRDQERRAHRRDPHGGRAGRFTDAGAYGAAQPGA